MLESLLSEFSIYGDEESSFECSKLFDSITERVTDNEIDIQTIFRYLLETTNFMDWIEETYHDIKESDEMNEEYTPEECEYIDIFNAQAELLEQTQKELRELKKKYNKLLRKYKGMKSSL